jgi:hypothetical protein
MRRLGHYLGSAQSFHLSLLEWFFPTGFRSTSTEICDSIALTAGIVSSSGANRPLLGAPKHAQYRSTICSAGQGWNACKACCAPDATFAAQAEPLAGLTTLAQYTEWMKGLLTILADGRYELKSLAVDLERNNVVAYEVFSGTHTGPGGRAILPARARGPITSTTCSSIAKDDAHDENLALRFGNEGSRLGMTECHNSLWAAGWAPGLPK